MEVLERLGIGKCKLTLQTPIGSFSDPKELVGKRIVTSFPNLTRKYFGNIAQEGQAETQVRCVL